jgi:hypothetical protein
MEISEENAPTTGIPLMLDPNFLSDKGMPIWYASVYGTRYYGKTPAKVVERLRKLVPSSRKGRRAAPAPKSIVESATPLEMRPMTIIEPPRAEILNMTNNNDYMSVPYLNVLGLPKSMQGMRVKRVTRASPKTRKSRSSDMLRDVHISPKKKKTRKATRLLVSRGER